MAARARTYHFVVIHIGWRYRLPGRGSGGMAGIAIVRRVNVRCTLSRRDISVVTANTGANHLRMIHRSRSNWCPGSREFLVAGIAQIGGVNMGGTLSTGVGAIVAIDTVIDEVRMIHTGWSPGVRGMADVTFVVGLEMRDALARGNGAVVATGTDTQHFIVIHVGGRYRLPRRGSGCMTRIAVISSVDMRCTLA